MVYKSEKLETDYKKVLNPGPGHYIPLKDYTEKIKPNKYSFGINDSRFKKLKNQDYFLPGPGSYFEDTMNEEVFNYNENNEITIDVKKNRLNNYLTNQNYIESKLNNIK